MAVSSSVKKSENKINPFPGLRPFTQEEAHLFFGREGQVDNVVNSLVKNKFIAVIGSSGSGKSSLIYCGVLAKVIEKGKWNVIVTRPGTQPFKSLSDSVHSKLENSPATDNEGQSEKEVISKLLQENYSKTKSSNVLIIDQFEELFRYSSLGEEDEDILLRQTYADYLVELVNQTEVPVYIIITMRSDFIGECSRFQSFTALINRSNYLIPRMSRENFKRVIEQPAKIFGSSIEEELVQKILEEVGDNQDQLPVLQHALMRTWSYWQEESSHSKVITLSDYNNIGGISRALSDHANEAFDELNLTEKLACEKIFRSLTEKGIDNKGVRRPSRVSNLAKISESTIEDVIKIVNTFRAEGRSFLTPSFNVEIDENSVIDLSHESLMRVWDRLNNWVDEEATAVGMYKRLSDSAANYQVGKTSLWRPPDLQLATNWRNKTKPNLAWAERHNPAFERTIVFLNTSEEEYDREERNKIRLQRVRLRRTRMFALVLGSVAIISLVMFLWTRQLSVNLEQQIIIAETKTEEAVVKTQEAEDERKNAQDALETARIEKLRADTATMVAEDRRVDAEASANFAITQTKLAEKNSAEAIRQSKLANENAEDAKTQQKLAEAATEEAYTQRMLSISNSMSVKSQQITSDKNLKALLAFQAFKFNEDYGGDNNDADIYNGLYSSLKMLKGNDYNILTGHSDAVRSVAFLNGSSLFYSSGSDGRILKWDMNTENNDHDTILEGRNIIEKIALTPNGDYLLAVENRNGMFLIDLNSNNPKAEQLAGDEVNIKTIAVSPDNSTVFTAGLGNFVEKWDLRTKRSQKFVETSSRVNTLSISPDGTKLVGGLKDGTTIIWQVSDAQSNEIHNDDSNPMQNIKFSPDGKYLVCGTVNGEIQILDTDSFKVASVLTGHVARVTDLAFSPDSKFMVSTSYDNSVMLWNMLDFTSPPVVHTDNSGFVFTVSFSGDGNYFISGSAEDPRMVVRPTFPDIMAKTICPLVDRNLTQDEWNIYVGDDIEFENTCNIIRVLKL